MGIFKQKYRTFFAFSLLALLSACSQYSSKFTNVAFHNTTAKYNAFYLAKEKLKEVEAKIKANHLNDFNEVLDILYSLDTVKGKQYKPDLKYCREKCSVIVQKHKNSKWVDNAYILVGKTKLYEGKFQQAGQFFKYVNTKSKDRHEKHAALAQLMRSFMEGEEEFNASAVSDYMEKQKLNHENERDLSLIRAQFHLEYEEWKEALEDLEVAIPHIRIRDEKSRAHFIAGQLRQRLGDNDGAYDHYKATLKKRPPYEFEFYAKLNMAQVNDASRGAEVKKIKKYFDKLLIDEKNEEYKDRIYYEKALYELKLDNVNKSIEFLNLSLKENKGNNLQKAYTYLELGKINYDLTNFEKSKLYYDSVMKFLPKDFRKFDEIEDRQKVLTNFVDQLSIVNSKDSLIKVSAMDSTDREKLIRETARKMKQACINAKKEAYHKSKLKEEKKIEAYRNVKNPFVFYNPDLLARAKLEFESTWGRVKNEDDWRRTNKEAISDFDEPDEIKPPKDSIKPEKKDTGPDTSGCDVDTKPFYSAVLKSQKEIDMANNDIREAMYKLGKIYDLQLKEPNNAIKTFERLLERYPKSEHEDEVMYFLYLLCRNNESCSSDHYKDRIFNEYPHSIYKEVILDPEYMLKNKQTNQVARELYDNAFILYREGRYFEARKAIDAISRAHPHNDIKDKLALVRAYTLAKTHGLPEYKKALETFLVTYRKSSLIPKVGDDLAKCMAEMQNRNKYLIADTVKVIYLEDDFREEHFLLSAYGKSEKTFESVLPKFYNFNKRYFANKRLKTSKTDLSSATYFVKVAMFINQDTAKTYLKALQQDTTTMGNLIKGDKQTFIISKRNLSLLVNSKDLDGYLEFYRRKYKLDD